MLKKINLKILLILVVLSLVAPGCEKKKKNEDTPKTSNLKLVDKKKELVYTIKEENGYKTPAINLDYDSIKEVNEEIDEFGEKKLKDIREAEKAEILSEATLDYKYYENDNVLSLFYEYHIASYMYSDDYKIWNVDKYTGKVLTNEEILEKKGMTEEEFKSKYKEALGNCYEETYKDTKDMINKKVYNEQYKKTIADKNCSIDNPMFLNEKNELIVISKIYSVAGADYYLDFVNVN